MSDYDNEKVTEEGNNDDFSTSETFEVVDIDISEDIHDAILAGWMFNNLDEASLYHYNRIVDDSTSTHRGLSKAEALYEAIFNMEAQRLLMLKINEQLVTQANEIL